MAISERQKKILAFPYSDYDAIICDGAVRSGKTSIMSVSFLRWAMENFSYQRFGLCGKTVDSCWKNLVTPLISLSYIKQRYTIRVRRSEKIIEARRGKNVNYFEVFGGKDEGSAALIQGRTLAGVLLDEVVLMPESFVNQALARCSVDGAKIWFSCNPGSPEHWFKKEWIDRREEHNALYLHFEMTDNPSLSEKTLARYQSMYAGVFYDRYIRGLWVLAEGLVYPMFDKDKHTFTEPTLKGPEYISIDYGTANPMAMGLWVLGHGEAEMIKEYYYSGRDTKRQKTDEEYYHDLEKFAEGHNIDRVIVDPSAASFIECIRRHGKFNVIKANNSVLDGIRLTGALIQAGKLRFHASCTNTFREFGSYVWDEDSTEDAVIKENDHCLTGETLVDTVCGQFRIDELVGKSGCVYCTDGEQREIGVFHDVRMTQKEAEVFEVTLADGRIVKATADHPILTRRGWVQIKDLRGDDEIACIGGMNDESRVQRGQENSVL